ncbi:hypothetical protein ACFL17_07575 [Pseudomonadota bacterium]
MKKFNYCIVLIILTYAFVELVSYAGIAFLSKVRHTRYEPVDTITAKHQKIVKRFIAQETDYYAFSPTLGWTVRKNGSKGLYQANSSALRSNREYSIKPPRHIHRISTFGDSFTHGDDVKNNETWQAVMENTNPGLEVLNFGVGGFGLDQAYLRYLEDGRQFKSHLVFIGYMSENINRNVNTYRPFYHPKTGTPLTKPRFIVKDGNLTLLPNPMQRLGDYKTLLLHPQERLTHLGSNDYFFKRRYTSNMFDWSPTVKLVKISTYKFSKRSPEQDITLNGHYNPSSEAFVVTKRIFDDFYSSAIKNQSTPIILIFPDSTDVTRYRKKNKKRYSPLLSYLNSVGYKYIDLMGAFQNTAIKDLFSGHYTPLANRLVAKHILKNFDHQNRIGN